MRKHAVLQFMAALSSSQGVPPTPIIPPLIPSISRASPQSPLPRSRRPSFGPPADRSVSKSKAQILREYRAKHGRSHIPEPVLLRDALYLLQGISGKYVKFSDAKNETEVTVIFTDDPVSYSSLVLFTYSNS
jgi:gamma-tubulin complex component 3